MSRSEFRFNNKRKHYAYLFKNNGEYRKNLLLTSKSLIKKKKKKNGIYKIKSIKTVPLTHHPDVNDDTKMYVDKRIYNDHIDSFSSEIKTSWSFDKNDKRKIKRLKHKKM